MKGPPVYMKINKELVKYLSELNSNYEDYIRNNGEIIVKLKKALYGCVQSGLLWYNHIKTILEYIVCFSPNPCDTCVFNCGTGDELVTIIIYVDDLFITSRDTDAVDDVCKYLKSQFPKVKVNEGSIHHYLGMTFDFASKAGAGAVVISMQGYINDLLSQYNVTKTATTTANNNLFHETDKTKLSYKESKELHTIVTKLLYLATRVRFEIMLSVNYLTTRVNKFTKGDVVITMRILEYLNGTRNLGLTLCIGDEGPENVHLYADASYGVHEDGKSHSAGVVKVGDATVNAKSQKQKIVTKSSSEAELVCASDNLGLGDHVSDFLKGHQINVDAINLHQDNTSTFALMCK